MDVKIAMKLLSQKILLIIKENYIEAINKLSTESFDVYGFINDEFKNTEDITKNHLFQFVFRSFYRLDNAGGSFLIKKVGQISIKIFTFVNSS